MGQTSSSTSIGSGVGVGGGDDPFAQPQGQDLGRAASAQVKIVDTELDAETNKVYYVMDIVRPPSASVQGVQRVRKRYSEFEALRRDLSAQSKAAKALEFPKKQRIKGKRGGRKEKTVDKRAPELEIWLNIVIRICENEAAHSLLLLQMIEDWFVAAPAAVSTTAGAAAGGNFPGSTAAAAATGSAAVAAAVPTGGRRSGVLGSSAALLSQSQSQSQSQAQAQAQAQAQEEADIMAAIEASNAQAAAAGGLGGTTSGSGSGSGSPVAPAAAATATATATMADEEAEMLRAIQMSLGQPVGASQPPQHQRGSFSPADAPGAAATPQPLSLSPQPLQQQQQQQLQPQQPQQPPPQANVNVNTLPATVEAIEMGFPPDKVRRLQSEQQAATGSAYTNTQELLEALMSI
eukprot:COSAG06_NODE_2092_length_7609_cov_4.560852_4_plen_405_part_00